MQIIPLAQIPSQTCNVTLGGQTCIIFVYTRQERLYLDLKLDKAPIALGALCQERTDVIQSSAPYFSGTLHFLDLEGQSPPRWEKLYTGESGRWVLAYLQAEEPESALDEAIKKISAATP